MLVTAFFQNEGVPASGLTPSITITDLDTVTAVVSAATMVEVGSGIYKYDFTAFDQTGRYFAICDGGATLLDPDRYATADSFNAGEIKQILEDTNEIQGDVNLVLADTDEIQTDLANGGRLDLLVGGIKERTDLLPDDPASQTTTSTAILTAESNIRGADSDTLETLSDQLDTIETKTDILDTVADAIQARTDLFPDDPASQAAVATAISNSESNIRGADSDTLGILSGQLDSNYSAIASIQNNTTRRIDIPTRLVIPDSGADVVIYRFILGLYDTTGQPEIPDETPTVQVENISGTERLATTAMTQYLADDGVTVQDGQYYYDYSVADTETLENLIVTVKLIEDGVTTYHRRTTEVTEFEADLTEMQADVTDIKSKTDCLPSNTSTQLTSVGSQLTTVQNTLDDAAISLTTINTAVGSSESNIISLLENATYGFSALKMLLDDIDTNDESAARFDEIKGFGWTTETLVQLNTLLGAIKAKSDYLPVDTAQELIDIDTELAATRERTDRLPDDPADHSVVINAVSQAETNIRGGEYSLKTTQDQITTHDTDVKTALDTHDQNIKQDIADHNTNVETIITTHDIGVKSAITTHDTGMKTALDAHDSTIKGQITTHDTSVRSELAIHDTDVKSVIASHDTEVKGNLATHDTDMKIELVTHDTGIHDQLDIIQGSTDNLTGSPADQAAIETAITQAETNIRGGAETLQAFASRLSIHDNNIEGVLKAMGMAIMGSQEKDLTLLSDELALHDQAVQGGSDGVLEAITQVETNIRGGDESLETLKARQENAQADLSFIRGIEGGMWKIKGAQMIFYAEDNITEIARFNLYDVSGQESATNVYTRKRV